MATSLSFGILFFLLLCLREPLLHATDTISADRPLSGNQKLISQGGKFALGFFQPAGGSPEKWYIGIWYNKISVQTVVWVANRDKPISDPASSQLTMSADGNMVLLNQFKSQIWSTNVSNIVPNSTVVVLLDTSNLVLSRASNTSSVLWQSFDHLTDTWLPGNKLSWNKVTGARTRLVSWKDPNDPSPGMFSIEMDPNDTTQYLFIWNNSHPYFTGGKYNGGAFSGIPEMTAMPNSMYTFQYVDNDQESYFMFTVKDNTILSRLTIDMSGQDKSYVWMEERKDWMLFFSQPKAKCSVYSVCGAFSRCTENALPPCSCLQGFNQRYPSSWKLGDYTGGCVRNAVLPCGSNSSTQAKKDQFYMMNNVKLPDQAIQSIEAAGVHDCKLACLNNCSCSAYSYNGSCSLWYADLINLQDNFDGSGDSIYIRLAASELPDSRTKKWWIIGVVVGGVAILASLIAAALYFLLRSKRRITGLNHVDGSLIIFKYSDLQIITKNFSEKLGGGSFGSVFKGLMPDVTVVAVKKLEGLRQGEKQFRAEVSTIGTIQHINLIRLLGFCSDGARKLLVYEYMPNSSLDRHLFGSSSEILNWNTRYQIAIGIAKGLSYLHEKCRDCIIHCDIKPQNILLDASFVPKVADFGLAKLVGRDFSRVLTTMRGTIGYLAPEWISGMAITSKADVFSYGMMLFEIISRKRNVEQGEQSAKTFFPVLIAKKLHKGDMQTLLDPELASDANSEELGRACKVACWCVQDDENSRPTMGEIVQILEGLVDVNIPPIPRYLQVLAERVDHVKFSSDEPSN